jgi:hypothetical protein
MEEDESNQLVLSFYQAKKEEKDGDYMRCSEKGRLLLMTHLDRMDDEPCYPDIPIPVPETFPLWI